MYSSKATKKMLKLAVINGPYDLVIVPGVPLEDGKWSRTMKDRTYWAKYLYDAGIAKNIMFSGAAVYTPYPEAEVMIMYAEALGIPRANLFGEVKAQHSTENIYYSYKKGRKLGFNKIALASDPLQTRLLKRFTHKKVDPDVILIPAVYDTLRKMKPLMFDPTLDFSVLEVRDFQSITKRESFWKRLRGTRGANLDKTIYE
jgi:uncharacterized SAM-binding protein YcdF (DUF218 family)